MRERSLRVDTLKLQMLSKIHKPSRIAKTLEISKQRWNNYKSGRHDVPESVLDNLCSNFNLDKSELVLAP